MWNLGDTPRYEGPLLKKLIATPPPIGKLIAWNPVEQREVWNVTYPVVESGGVLATAGNLVFQGRADGMFSAYRATDGQKVWELTQAQESWLRRSPTSWEESNI
jgi:glucose dehydrogenase